MLKAISLIQSMTLIFLFSVLLSACGASSTTTVTNNETVETSTTVSQPVVESSTDPDTGIITQTSTVITTQTTLGDITATITVVTTTDITITITNPMTGETTVTTNSDSNTITHASELDRAIETMVDTTIVSNVNNFQTQVQSLDNQTSSFCANTTQANLTQTQNQWISTHNAWYQLAPFIFGPLEVANVITVPAFWYLDSYRNNGNDYTGTVRTNLTSLLESDGEISEIDFSNLNYNQVGLLALEVSLFERSTDQSQTLEDITNEFINASRKCELLMAYSQELLRQTTLIQLGWNDNYHDTGKSYRELLLSNQLEAALDNESGDSAISKITVAMQEFYDYLNKRNVTTDVAQLSNATKQALLASASITESLLNTSSESSLSIYTLMAKNDHEQDATTISTNIQTFVTAINTGTDEEIKSAAAALDGNFKRELPDALNVSLGLNFTDGD